MLRIAWLIQMQSSLNLLAQTKVIYRFSTITHLINYIEVMMSYNTFMDNGCHVYIKI